MSKKKRNEKNNEAVEEEVFNEYAFIAGYTEGGVPFGILHGEMEDDKKFYFDLERNLNPDLFDDLLPF